jgi:hypothetical protein
LSTITVTVGDITLYGDAGHEFTLVSMSGFDDLPSAKTEQDSWARADGNAIPGTTYYDGRTITVNGYYATSTVEDTDEMMRRLRGMAGRLVTVTVQKGAGVALSCDAELRSMTVDEYRYRGKAAFQIGLLAPSPYLYGPLRSQTVGVPTDGEGITDPLLDPLSEGEVGNPGRVAITGSGFAPTHLVVKIRGGLSEGVRIHCIETGEAVEFHRQINPDETMMFDFDDERVLFQNQSDLSMFLTEENWFHPYGDATIQFTPLGVQSGTPSMTVEWKEAWR